MTNGYIGCTIIPATAAEKLKSLRFSAAVTRQNAFYEDFSIINPPNSEEDIRCYVDEIHGPYSILYTVPASSKDDNSDITEEYKFSDEDIVLIVDDTCEEEEVDIGENLDEAAKDKHFRLKRSVEHLRKFLDDIILIDNEDFQFNEICTKMYSIYRSRLSSTEITNQQLHIISKL